MRWSLLRKLMVTAFLAALVAAIGITAVATAGPRPRLHRPRPRAAARPARHRRVRARVRPTVRPVGRPVRLPAVRPIVVAGYPSSVVVIDQTGQTDDATEAPTEGFDAYETTSTCAISPVDADTNLAGSAAYKVVSLADDGLAIVMDIDGEKTKVRMIGVAPLSVKPATSGADSSAEVHASLAKRRHMTELFIENLLRGESLHVVYDEMVAEEDEDGKYVAYLYRSPDGLLVNTEIIRQGFGAADTRYEFEEKDSFVYYQNKAATLGKGLWRRD